MNQHPKSSSAHRKLLLTLPDYERIHNVIRSVLDSYDADSTHACQLFAVVGAHLLGKYHGLRARPIAGAAFYSLRGDAVPDVLAFARIEGLEAVSDFDAYHCWVECEGWAIDFMAPLLGKNAAEQGFERPVPRKMFQRHLSTMNDDWGQLLATGDFHLIGNFQLTNALLEDMRNAPSTGDIAEICASWYRPTPRQMLNQITTASTNGSRQSIELKRVGLVGAW